VNCVASLFKATVMSEISAYGKTVQTDTSPRCWRCSKLLAEHVSRPWSIVCPRCKGRNGDTGNTKKL